MTHRGSIRSHRSRTVRAGLTSEAGPSRRYVAVIGRVVSSAADRSQSDYLDGEAGGDTLNGGADIDACYNWAIQTSCEVFGPSSLSLQFSEPDTNRYVTLSWDIRTIVRTLDRIIVAPWRYQG